MKVSVEWCLKNLSKAFKIHEFNGSIEQFKKVLELAKKNKIEFTKDITAEMINEVLDNQNN